jgi:hypothetical protein
MQISARLTYPFIKIIYLLNKGKICRLCLKKKPLQRESYIVPKFFYKGIFDEDNKLNKLRPFEYVNANGMVNRPSSGEYDEWILCRECETKIGRYESYGAITFFGSKSKVNKRPKIQNYITNNGRKYFLIDNLDYCKFKLFMLSMLWKTAVTDREFGENISLGFYEEVLRKRLYRETPGRFEDFPFLVFSMLQHKNIESGLIAQPSSTTFKGYKICKFLVQGFWINYIVSLNVKDDFIKQCTVNCKGECKILQMDEKTAKNSLLGYFGLT